MDMYVNYVIIVHQYFTAIKAGAEPSKERLGGFCEKSLLNLQKLAIRATIRWVQDAGTVNYG